MKQVLYQKPILLESEVTSNLRQLDKKASIFVQSIIYYPYYFFEYEMRTKKLRTLNGMIACTVDALSGKEAIIDVKPEFSTHELDNLFSSLPIQIDREEASQIAEKFILNTAMEKAKYLTLPSLEQKKQLLFYRPFWIIDYFISNKREGQFIVDAVDGCYHPL